jgi:hypothetical protein
MGNSGDGADRRRHDRARRGGKWRGCVWLRRWKEAVTRCEALAASDKGIAMARFGQCGGGDSDRGGRGRRHFLVCARGGTFSVPVTGRGRRWNFGMARWLRWCWEKTVTDNGTSNPGGFGLGRFGPRYQDALMCSRARRQENTAPSSRFRRGAQRHCN